MKLNNIKFFLDRDVSDNLPDTDLTPPRTVIPKIFFLIDEPDVYGNIFDNIIGQIVKKLHNET